MGGCSGPCKRDRGRDHIVVPKPHGSVGREWDGEIDVEKAKPLINNGFVFRLGGEGDC